MNRPFLISIYSLTALSGAMIAFAEEIAFPSGLTLPLAILAYYFNEKTQRIRIRTLWANALGIVAFGIAATELLIAGYSQAGFAAEGRLLAGAHLLSYLVWIALFQDKKGRQYWWLMALGVMQVAVGSILSQEPLFGALLLIYVFLALWTLSVFSLYQAHYGFEIAGESATGLSLHPAGSGITAASLAAPWSGQADEYRGAIQLDPNEQWVNRRFVLGIVTTALISICVGVVFFVLIPRLWVGKQHNFGDRTGAGFSKVTGFADEVQLGEIGQILESNDRVLEVRFSDADSAEPLDVEESARRLGYDEPLFRGSVMGSYQNGRWQILPQSQEVTELYPPMRMRGLIRQHYIVLDGSSRTLFGMHPVFFTEFAKDEQLRPSIDVVTSILFRQDNDRQSKGKLEYVLFGSQPRRPFRYPIVFQTRSFLAQLAQQKAMTEFLKLPDGLERLEQFAQEIADTVSAFEESPDPPDMRIARAIEQRLQSSGEYTYSLRNDIVDPSIDPVEDFLFNRKQGHCEYSASAMALMLRAVNIPSRLVSGFKGGQTSGFSGAFVVEGRHAHAWVEAWVDGRWRTFDPTPFARADSVAEIGAEKSALSSFQNQMAGFWDQRIVRMSIDEQKSMIYAPLGNIVKMLTQKASSPFGETGKSVVDFLSDPRRWFSIETFIGTAILMTLIVVAKFLWRKYGPQDAGLIRWLFRQLKLLSLRLIAGEDRIRVEFYERFLAILARQGLIRRPSQTPLEFAVDVEARLSALLTPAELEHLPESMATKFYQVRYGNQSLSLSDLSSINASLERLNAVIRKR